MAETIDLWVKYSIFICYMHLVHNLICFSFLFFWFCLYVCLFSKENISKMTSLQWCTIGFWCPGQELKLVPLFLIFTKKFSKMVDPKQKCRSFSKKKSRVISIHLQSSMYTFHELFWISLWSLTNMCQMVSLPFSISGRFQHFSQSGTQGMCPPPPHRYATTSLQNNILFWRCKMHHISEVEWESYIVL